MTLDEIFFLFLVKTTDISVQLPYIFTQGDKMEYVVLFGATIVAAVYASGVVVL